MSLAMERLGEANPCSFGKLGNYGNGLRLRKWRLDGIERVSSLDVESVKINGAEDAVKIEHAATCLHEVVPS